MPDPVTHATIASNATAASMVGVAAVGQALGLDYVAMFYAFMGAVCWRAIQPKLAPTFDEISGALGWAALAMLLGTLGAVVLALFAENYFLFVKQAPRATLIGLLASLLGFFCVPVVQKCLQVIKDWRQS